MSDIGDEELVGTLISLIKNGSDDDDLIMGIIIKLSPYDFMSEFLTALEERGDDRRASVILTLMAKHTPEIIALFFTIDLDRKCYEYLRKILGIEIRSIYEILIDADVETLDNVENGNKENMLDKEDYEQLLQYAKRKKVNQQAIIFLSEKIADLSSYAEIPPWVRNPIIGDIMKDSNIEIIDEENRISNIRTDGPFITTEEMEGDDIITTKGCNMFKCCHELAEDERDLIEGDSDDYDWFIGYCIICKSKIRKYNHTIRYPLENGCWKGCYCSVKCCNESIVETDVTDDDYVNEKVCGSCEKEIEGRRVFIHMTGGQYYCSMKCATVNINKIHLILDLIGINS